MVIIMTKLLIVEDEPLVQVGIRSLINWEDINIEICGIAKDGIQGLELIEKHQPYIVITDIKMPRMNGLELMKESKERFGKLPVFIILTSYEDFSFLKEAMKYDVVEYLIKLELNTNDLMEAITKCFTAIKEITIKQPIDSIISIADKQSFNDKFFIKLLFNLFENQQQFKLQAKELNLSFDAHSYALCHCEIVEYTPMWQDSDTKGLLNLYSSTLQMIQEITKKYLPCYITSLDMKHFAIIFCLNEDHKGNYKEVLHDILTKTFSMAHNYFNVTILTSISSPCISPSMITETYQEARQIFSLVNKETPILFYEDLKLKHGTKNTFNMSLFREDIKHAFEEYDTETVSKIFTQIAEIFMLHPTYFTQSIDAASNILYLAISLLPNGDELVSNIFQSEVDGYRSLYRKNNVEQVANWLLYFRDGLCLVLNEHNKNYRNHIVSNVKKYIDSHITEKLSLNDVSYIFGISPNYLSQLFKKYSEDGFTDYITKKKIAKAKVMMKESTLKLYEISDTLGFENSFYFSKVFKKIEGCSPRDYIHKS